MAAGAVVTCPKCTKKFKPKTDVEGKKIKCPFCTRPFVVSLAKEPKKPKDVKDAKDAKDAKDTRIKPAAAVAKTKPPENKPTAAETQAAVAAADKKKLDDSLEVDPNPYGVKNQDLVPRCPYCAKEMENENAIICLHCGYNTLTRTAGKTDKIFGLTVDRHIKYLLPPLGAALFVFFSVMGLIFNATVFPFMAAGQWYSFVDSEPVRLGLTIVWLGFMWTAGMYCFKMFIVQPKPDDLKME